MGACTFRTTGYGKTAQEAFRSAVAEATAYYGHQEGYSGAINAKHSFQMVTVPDGQDLNDFIDEMEDDKFSDKWGPAGCIDMGEGKYLFFGWAPE